MCDQLEELSLGQQNYAEFMSGLGGGERPHWSQLWLSVLLEMFVRSDSQFPLTEPNATLVGPFLVPHPIHTYTLSSGALAFCSWFNSEQ